MNVIHEKEFLLYIMALYYMTYMLILIILFNAYIIEIQNKNIYMAVFMLISLKMIFINVLLVQINLFLLLMKIYVECQVN